MSDSSLVTILSTIGTVLWSVQLIPQIIYNYRRKNCEGLPPIMLFLWAACGVPFSIYLCSTNSAIALQVQPQLFTFLCFVTWMQSLYYPPIQISKKKIYTLGAIFLVVSLALELAFIIPLKHLYMTKNVQWPPIIFGAIASALLALGLIPPYFELAKRQGRVVGINFIFLLMDFSGAVFSALSVAVGGEVDIMGVVLYGIVGVLELGIFISQGIWLLRFKVFARGSVDDAELQDAASIDVTNEKATKLEKDEEEDLDTAETRVETSETRERELSSSALENINEV